VKRYIRSSLKRYIKSASYRPPIYSGAALETYEKILNGLNRYTPNEFYVNEQYGQIFYINNAGFLHVLQKENGCIEDYMLTKNNTLKFSNTYCRPKYDKDAWDQFKQMIKDAKRV
jgi:hypothetical protein